MARRRQVLCACVGLNQPALIARVADRMSRKPVLKWWQASGNIWGSSLAVIAEALGVSMEMALDPPSRAEIEGWLKARERSE